NTPTNAATRTNRSMTVSTDESGIWSDNAFNVTDDETDLSDSEDKDHHQGNKHQGENGQSQAHPDTQHSYNFTSAGLGLRWPSFTLAGLGEPTTHTPTPPVPGTSCAEVNDFLSYRNINIAQPLASVSKID